MFLSAEPSTQLPTLELVERLKRKLSVPIVAAGGIATNSDVKAAMRLGASGVQVGTSYLLCDEAKTSDLHREALKSENNSTALTNVFSGRLARGITNKVMKELNYVAGNVPEFPYASIAIAPLRTKAEEQGKSDFTPLWSGTNRAGCKEASASEITSELWGDDY